MRHTLKKKATYLCAAYKAIEIFKFMILYTHETLNNNNAPSKMPEGIC